MSSLSLGLAGDTMPTRPLKDQTGAIPADSAPIFEFLRSADLTIANLELPITDGKRHPIEKPLIIWAEPHLAGDIVEMGIDIANIANNHSVDYGWDGLVDTIDALSPHGVKCVGAGETIEQALAPAIVEVRGKKVAVLGISCLLPTGVAAGEGRPGVAPIHIHVSYEIDAYFQMEEPGEPNTVRVCTRADEVDIARVEAAISALKKQVDLVVVSIHWGFGSTEQLADYQVPLSRRLIDAGADVIHGHHPHAVHPVGFYKGKPIIFAPGTLIAQQVFLPANDWVKGMWKKMSLDGFICSVAIDDDGASSVTVIPTVLNGSMVATPATGEVFDRIAERLVRLCPLYGGSVALEGRSLKITAKS